MAKKDQFNLGENVTSNAFEEVVNKFENVNADCELVSKFIKNNYDVLGKVTPKELTSAYQYLSLPIDEKPASLKKTLSYAFPEDFGDHLYELMDKTGKKEVTMILDNLEKIRSQIFSPNQKNLFK